MHLTGKGNSTKRRTFSSSSHHSFSFSLSFSLVLFLHLPLLFARTPVFDQGWKRWLLLSLLLSSCPRLFLSSHLLFLLSNFLWGQFHSLSFFLGQNQWHWTHLTCFHKWFKSKSKRVGESKREKDKPRVTWRINCCVVIVIVELESHMNCKMYKRE